MFALNRNEVFVRPYVPSKVNEASVWRDERGDFARELNGRLGRGLADRGYSYLQAVLAWILSYHDPASGFLVPFTLVPCIRLQGYCGPRSGWFSAAASSLLDLSVVLVIHMLS